MEAAEAREVELQKAAEVALLKIRADADEEIALQNVALAEARKAASESVSQRRAELSSHSLERVQNELALAREGESSARADAERAENELHEQQARAEETLARLLEEHRR